MSIDAKVSSSGPADRASLWFIAIVLALTTAMSVQTIWWMWHPPDSFDRRSIWSMLHAIAWVAKELGWRWFLVAGGALVALATAGVLLRRTWGLALALPCAAALISAALIARYLAIFEEPRQYVPRSPYVQTATRIAFTIVASHGAASLLGLRLLWRDSPATSTVPLRAASILLALLGALIPVLWFDDGARGGATALIVWPSSAALLAALVAAILPRRATLLAALAAIGTALVTQAASLVILLGQRPRRHHVHSADAEHGLVVAAALAPALFALLGLCLVLRRRLRERAEAG